MHYSVDVIRVGYSSTVLTVIAECAAEAAAKGRIQARDSVMGEVDHEYFAFAAPPQPVDRDDWSYEKDPNLGTFNVTVKRHTYRQANIGIEAPGLKEAQEAAIERAGDLNFSSESGGNYVVTEVTKRI